MRSSWQNIRTIFWHVLLHVSHRLDQSLSSSSGNFNCQQHCLHSKLSTILSSGVGISKGWKIQGPKGGFNASMPFHYLSTRPMWSKDATYIWSLFSLNLYKTDRKFKACHGLSLTAMDCHGLSQTKILCIGNKQTDKQTLLDVKSLLRLKIDSCREALMNYLQLWALWLWSLLILIFWIL